MNSSQFPRIRQLVHVEPFKVTCLWSTGEYRISDFDGELDDWKQNEFLAPLTDYQIFRHVSVGESGTLQWENLPHTSPFGYVSPMDFDADVLYETSKPLSAYRLVPVDEAA